MALDKAAYYRQRVEQLKKEIALQRATIADLQQRLFMMEAELSAFEGALRAETQDSADNDPALTLAPPSEGLVPEELDAETLTAALNVQHAALLSALDEADAQGKNGEPASLAKTLRNILAHNSGGMTPSDIMEEFAARGQTIKREYLYALLSRLRSRGELKRRAKKYSINEARSTLWERDRA
jgi:hypothetical protein